VVADHDDSIDSTNDPGGIPWDYVGNRGFGSAVYLCDGWVITAGHVGEGAFDLMGTTYQIDQSINSGTGRYMVDGSLDLMMFRLVGDPGLAGMEVTSETNMSGNEVSMIGYGLPESGYQDNNTAFRNDDYYTWGARAKSWGTNVVDAEGFNNSGHSLFITDFDHHLSNGATAFEAQATNGDSGSGIFYNNGGIWELAGITVTVNTSDSTRTSIGDQTLAIDLASYKTQIDTIKTFDPVPEPSSTLLAGITALLLLQRRRR